MAAAAEMRSNECLEPARSRKPVLLPVGKPAVPVPVAEAPQPAPVPPPQQPTTVPAPAVCQPEPEPEPEPAPALRSLPGFAPRNGRTGGTSALRTSQGTSYSDQLHNSRHAAIITRPSASAGAAQPTAPPPLSAAEEASEELGKLGNLLRQRERTLADSASSRRQEAVALAAKRQDQARKSSELANPLGAPRSRSRLSASATSVGDSCDGSHRSSSHSPAAAAASTTLPDSRGGGEIAMACRVMNVLTSYPMPSLSSPHHAVATVSACACACACADYRALVRVCCTLDSAAHWTAYRGSDG